MFSIRTWTLATLLASATAAHAGPVAVDNFNSAAIGSLAGQTSGSGWASAWNGSSSVAVVDASATGGAFAGQALRFSGTDNNSAASRVLSNTISSSRVVVDFNLQFSSGAIDTNDFLSLWLGNVNGPSIGVKGNCDGAANCNGADLFVRTTGSSGSFATPMVVGTTYHLFALLEKVNGSALYNRYSLWIDPTESEMFSFTGADAVFNGSSGISSFNTIGFRTANLDAGDAVLVDNVTISELPEPGSVALAMVALMGVFASTRRRR